MKSYKSMANINLDNLKVSELQQYIRDMSKRVVSNMRNADKEISNRAKDVVKELGTYRRKGKTYLKLGFGKYRKSELLERAEKLQGFARTYTENKFELDERHTKGYESFKKKFGNLGKYEYDQLTRTLDKISDILDDFGSEVVQMYYTYKKSTKGGNPTRFGDIVRECYAEVINNGGGETEDVIDLIYEKITEEVG